MVVPFERRAGHVGPSTERRDGPPRRDGNDRPVADRRVKRGLRSMTLLVTPDELRARREILEGPLRLLALSLAAELELMVGAEPFIPPEKALLSREGGRCPRDGALLDFDPLSPHAHRCRLCGEVYTGELHYRFWIYW